MGKILMQSTIPKYGPIFWKNYMPRELSGLKIPGTFPFTANGKYGTIMFQAKNTEHYSLTYSFIHAREDFDIFLEDDKNSLGMMLLFDNSILVSGEQESHFLKPGQFDFVFHPTLSYSIHFVKDKTYGLFELRISKELLFKTNQKLFGSFLETIQVDNKEHFLCKASPAHIFLIDCMECLKNRVWDQSIVDKILRTIHHSCLNPPTQKVTDEHHILRMYEAKEFIRQHPDKHFNIKKLSTIAGTNEKYLKRDFKNVFGLTPFSYYRYVRNYNIKRLLATTDYSISDIAHYMGMEDLTSFHHLFDSISNLTPLEWRIKAREQGSYCKDWIDEIQ